MYKNREEAGQQLTQLLSEEKIANPCLLALPRGGVVVAAPIAEKFQMRVKVLITRKVRHPFNPEVAVGAIMPNGAAILDESTERLLDEHSEWIKQEIHQGYCEIQRRAALYSEAACMSEVKGQTVIVVDDGIATGYTLRAALYWLKSMQPAKLIVAVPVAPLAVIAQLAHEVDVVLCPVQVKNFVAVGMYYEDFAEVTDEEVLQILKA